MKKTLLSLSILLLTALFFFRSFFLHGLVPIPADTIVGLYHPYRDFYVAQYPRGIPFKNFLITDPVRQQYPWRILSSDVLSKFQFPLWNPYTLAGTPLLANFQSAVFYPLNLLYVFLPFSSAWSLQVFLQIILAGIFMYFYMKNLLIDTYAPLFSSIAFTFSGFAVSWLEWNTVVQTALWLPLILLSIDKIIVVSVDVKNIKTKHAGQAILPKTSLFWVFLFVFALMSSFFAGHLQTFFYVLLVQFCYLVLRILRYSFNKRNFLVIVTAYLIFGVLTAIQWIPTLRLIALSARSVDMNWMTAEGWFIPWQHLLQFIIPDFFGNPATLNYWGVWNYGELVGYIGIVPLLMALFALFFRYDRKTLFFGLLFFISLVFSLPTFLAKLPFLLSIPFLSTAQPTRLLFITDFSLAVLAGLGLDFYIRTKNKIIYPMIFIGVIFLCVWLFLLFGEKYLPLITADNLSIAKKNTYLPFAIYILSSMLIVSQLLFLRKQKQLIVIALLVITIFDIVRFAGKFDPFTKPQYLYPSTKTASFLEHHAGISRIMTTDSTIFPPNFSVLYKLQSVDGYDPLYLQRYGELIAASERKEPNIQPPFGFNRIITPHNTDSRIVNLLGVKYILSLTDITGPTIHKVFQEGDTSVFENTSALPRAFIVTHTVNANTKQEAIQKIFNPSINLNHVAVVENAESQTWADGTVSVATYTENKVMVETNIPLSSTESRGFLVLTDSYYPTWRVKIINEDTGESSTAQIIRTDYNFRGVEVPAGRNKVVFYDALQ